MAEMSPIYLSGIVVKGFGRGSKDLGIPTANLDRNVVESLPAHVSTGVYFGYCQINSSIVYPAALSIGWNPFYHNKEKTVEVHVLNTFPDDFYGSTLRVIVLKYIRPESNFSSKEKLIEAIHADIANVREISSNDKYIVYKKDKHFSPPSNEFQSPSVESSERKSSSQIYNNL